MNQESWDAKVAELAPRSGAFLQSYAWGEFQASLGREVRRDEGKIDGKLWAAQGVRLPIVAGKSYWLLPKSPIGDISASGIHALVAEHFSDAIFARVEPSTAKDAGKRTLDVHPSTTRIVNLTSPRDELLAAMKPKHRYNIRVAEKHGVVVKIGGEELLDDFLRLTKETTARDKFSSHEPEYYRAMLRSLTHDSCRAFVAVAMYGASAVAANIMIDAFGTRTYLHGASGNENRNVMAPYKLHDVLMDDAQKKGLRVYDFWGVAPALSSESHPWAGISRFKEGFGGEVVTAPGTFDVVRQPFLYAFYRSARFVRRSVR